MLLPPLRIPLRYSVRPTIRLIAHTIPRTSIRMPTPAVAATPTRRTTRIMSSTSAQASRVVSYAEDPSTDSDALPITSLSKSATTDKKKRKRKVNIDASDSPSLAPVGIAVEGAQPEVTPKANSAKRKRAKKEPAAVAPSEDSNELAITSDTNSPMTPKTPKAKRRKKATEDAEYESPSKSSSPSKPKSPAKPRTPRKPKPEPVYVIPDVERKVTTFKGRLGYACLNSVLRNKKPASESVFCSRTCR